MGLVPLCHCMFLLTFCVCPVTIRVIGRFAVSAAAAPKQFYLLRKSRSARGGYFSLRDLTTETIATTKDANWIAIDMIVSISILLLSGSSSARSPYILSHKSNQHINKRFRGRNGDYFYIWTHPSPCVPQKQFPIKQIIPIAILITMRYNGQYQASCRMAARR